MEIIPSATAQVVLTRAEVNTAIIEYIMRNNKHVRVHKDTVDFKRSNGKETSEIIGGCSVNVTLVHSVGDAGAGGRHASFFTPQDHGARHG